ISRLMRHPFYFTLAAFSIVMALWEGNFMALGWIISAAALAYEHAACDDELACDQQCCEPVGNEVA
ncbi:MAG: hypothetical protein ACRDUV_08505, partial [Pseudonocardiaceae bacterium]